MKIGGKLYTALIFAILYAPILIIIVFSFNSSNSTAVFEDFSFKWYAELFKSEKTLEVLINSLVIAVLSALISTIIGTAAAVGIFNMKNKRLKSAVMMITNIPMMNPDIVTGVSIDRKSVV